MVIGNNDNLLKLGQGISSALMFIVPPIVFYLITRRVKPLQNLGFRSVQPFWLLFIGILLMFVSLPITNQLSTWNESMHLGLPKLEDWLQNMEKAATEVTERMLHVNTIGGLLYNLLIIALIPAIGEELTFRGVVQQALVKGCKNVHVGIILSAAIFSFIHFQFYGFLPRMFLGILLGYMFYITGSLWTSITMHFVNNGTAVVLYYLNNKGIIDIDPEHFGEMQYSWLTTISFVVTAALIGWCWWKAENDAKSSDE
jgi:membrane protease YdiL (CAAX protease family)